MSKTILRVEKNKDNPFVMIDRRTIENPALSWRAKGMLAYLLSRPDDWVVRLGDLVKRSSDGTHTVRAALHELMEAGHIRKDTVRENGRIKQWVYTVYEAPAPPDAVFQQVEKQHLVNRTLTNTNKDTKNKNTNTKTEDEDSKFVRRLYEDNIGVVNPLMLGLIRNASLTYPRAWFQPAFELAAKNNARSWRYVETILESWKNNGFGWKPERPAPPPRAAKRVNGAVEALQTYILEHQNG